MFKILFLPIIALFISGCGGSAYYYEEDSVFIPTNTHYHTYLEIDEYYSGVRDIDEAIRCKNNLLQDYGYLPIEGFNDRLKYIASRALDLHNPISTSDMTNSVLDSTYPHSYFYNNIKTLFRERGVAFDGVITYTVFTFDIDEGPLCEYHIDEITEAMSGSVCGYSSVYVFPNENKKGFALLCVAQ